MNPIKYFPRGLVQPETSFRFSAEALLLASFAHFCAALPKLVNLPSLQELQADNLQDPTPTNIHFADLGTGCGVIALATLLLWRQDYFENKSDHSFVNYNISAVGYELISELCSAAIQNAELLSLESHFSVQHLDLSLADINELVPALTYDFILANPPYRLLANGRAPKSKLRRLALFEEKGSMNIFAKVAAHALKETGAFYCVYPVTRKEYLLDLLPSLGLYPARLLPVYANLGKTTPFFLLESFKHSECKLQTLEPLVLYSGLSADSSAMPPQLSVEALNFCPFLSCN